MAARNDGRQDSQLGREEALQRRLDEMRRERESELKRIRHSATPVVHDGHRALTDLLDGRQPQASTSNDSASAAAAAGPSSSSSSPESSGSQTASARAILVEVRGLFESRPVSRILQSSSFRTELESLVRSSLTPRAVASAAPQAAPSAASASAPAPQAAPSASDFASLTRQRREEFVEEIGELLHSQLVTNTLDSGFRGRLETSVRRRVDALPDAGRSALEILRTLPPSGIVRNDFSHLGILPPDQQSLSGSSENFNDDAVSVVSLTTVPVVEPAVSRQLRQVQKEVAEMRRMMRLLMSGQLETQRMVRQEVSAAIAGQRAAETPQARAPVRAGSCLVCLSAAADTVMYRCGHLCLCARCSLDVRGRSERVTCPVCRASVTDMMRVFVAGIDATNA